MPSNTKRQFDLNEPTSGSVHLDPTQPARHPLVTYLASPTDKEGTVAHGKKCPDCGSNMYAKSEKDYPAGTEVVYECPCRFEEKVFEDK